MSSGIIDITPDRFLSRPSTASRFVGVPREKPFQIREVGYQWVSYSNIPLSMNPNSVNNRRLDERLRALCDVRVCMDCKYAFLSKGGTNRCTVCWFELQREYRTRCYSDVLRFIRTPTSFGRWVKSTSVLKSVHPWYPVPDLHSARVQKAIAATLEITRREQEEDRWIQGPSPRLVGNLYYPNVARIKKGIHYGTPRPHLKMVPRDHWTGRICAHPPTV